MIFGRPKPARLIATVKEFGDVVVHIGQREPAVVEAEIWVDAQPTMTASSIWHSGPRLITIRTSDIVATRIERP